MKKITRLGKIIQYDQIITNIYLVPDVIVKGDVVKVYFNESGKIIPSKGKDTWYYCLTPKELEAGMNCEILD